MTILELAAILALTLIAFTCGFLIGVRAEAKKKVTIIENNPTQQKHFETTKKNKGYKQGEVIPTLQEKTYRIS